MNGAGSHDVPGPGAVLERVSEGVVALDTDLRYTYVNDRAEQLLGYDAEEIAGRSVWELFPEAAESVAREKFEEAVETQSETSYVRYNEQREQWFEVRIYPDESGLSVFFRDVTDRRERVHHLERAETMFENTQDAVFLVDVDNGEGSDRFRLARVNPTYERLTGLSNDDLRGETIRAVFGEEEGGEIAARYRECIERREPIEYEEQLSVPEPESWWETRIAPVVVDGEVVQLVGSTRDVTDRKERERELRETTTTLEAIIESTPDAVVMVDEDGEVTRWNRAAEEIFGWSAEEVLGEPTPFVPEEKVEEFERFVDRLDAGETIRGVETVRRAKGGDRIDVSLSSTKVTVDGDLVGYLGTFEDISSRLEYERRLERQRDDLELLTQMMSHDVRNDLEVVVGYAELLAESVDDDSRAYAEEVLASARDAVELTQSARDLTAAMRQAENDPEPIPLKSTLESQLEQVRATHSGASVTVEGEVPAVRVLADERLSSVFRNLLQNAIQHNDEAVPEVYVTVEADEDRVTVEVADNGPGIPEEMKPEVFGRGEKGLDSEGTGIGLYLVRTLVEGYGGEVGLEDSDPKGSVFSVELRRA